jgi:hypothetical protein
MRQQLDNFESVIFESQGMLPVKNGNVIGDVLKDLLSLRWLSLLSESNRFRFRRLRARVGHR